MGRLKTLVVVLCIVLTGCGILSSPPQASQPAPNVATEQPEETQTGKPTASAKPTEPPTARPTPTPTLTPTEAPAPVEINIMAVGDIMFHRPIIDAAKAKGGGYDFNYSFQYIRDIVSSADLALGNFECTFGGQPYSVSGGKSFSAPDEAADALKWAGFDVLCTANNHTYDRKDAGLLRTVETIRGKGLQCIGTRADAAEKPYIILDVKGVKVGLTAYTYGARPGGSGVALNGIRMSAKTKDLVNVFQPSSATAELAKMKQTVEDMRAEGADVVLFCMHWGTEDERTPNSAQKKMAQGLADAGVDVIFASHPHVLQTADVIQSQKTGKKTYVLYSLGNFISNQRSEYEPRWVYTEDGMIGSVKIVKRPDTGETTVTAMQYLPTWTFMYTSGGLRRYTVVPLGKALANPKDFGITLAKDVKKAQKSWDHTQALLKDPASKGLLSLMDADG